MLPEQPVGEYRNTTPRVTAPAPQSTASMSAKPHPHRECPPSTTCTLKPRCHTSLSDYTKPMPTIAYLNTQRTHPIHKQKKNPPRLTPLILHPLSPTHAGGQTSGNAPLPFSLSLSHTNLHPHRHLISPHTRAPQTLHIPPLSSRRLHPHLYHSRTLPASHPLSHPRPFLRASNFSAPSSPARALRFSARKADVRLSTRPRFHNLPQSRRLSTHLS